MKYKRNFEGWGLTLVAYKKVYRDHFDNMIKLIGSVIYFSAVIHFEKKMKERRRKKKNTHTHIHTRHIKIIRVVCSRAKH